MAGIQAKSHSTIRVITTLTNRFSFVQALLAISVCVLLSACQEQPSASQRSALMPTTDVALHYTIATDAKSLSERCDTDLTAITKTWRSLETLPEPYTVETVLRPLDQLYIDINNATSMVFLLSNVHPNPKLQQAADHCVQEFSKLLTNISLSGAIYHRLTAVDTEHTDAATKRFQLHQIRSFKRAGVDKTPTQREQIRALTERITELGQQFSKNIRTDVRSISLPGSDSLQGLPADYIAQHPADESGKITITTDYPDLFPFLSYAENDEARKQLYREYLNRAYPQNQPILREIIELRYQLATLLGYADFASYATEEMMVKTPQQASDFINQIDQLATARAEQDYHIMLQALQKKYPAASEVGSWQKTYAEELVRKQRYDIDTKSIRQYFQYGKVKSGIFDLVEQLFGIEIIPWDAPTWHPSVESYSLRENGKVIGHFYLDMHPRQNKYKHAAEFDVQAGVAGKQLPVAALVCNFPGADNPAALMEHQDVETFLHEFGHLLHFIFAGQQQWGLFSGIATEQDFIEAPSQMLQEWIWDYDTLSRFAINAAGQPIPQTLVKKMRAARDFGRGLFVRNQMFYAALSLHYYHTPLNELNLDQAMEELQNRYSPFPLLDDTYFYASFGHLYSYSAAYYTYMWSEVIAADILQRFEQQGMRNSQLANHYRQSILAPGGSQNAEQLVTNFLGRPFNFDAFIKKLNRQPH